MSCVRRVAACVHAWLDRPGRLPADMATSALVWISGASGGIGAALAASVPFEGAHTFDLSRSGGAPGTEHVPADLSDPAAWAAVAAASKRGRVSPPSDDTSSGYTSSSSSAAASKPRPAKRGGEGLRAGFLLQ